MYTPFAFDLAQQRRDDLIRQARRQALIKVALHVRRERRRAHRAARAGALLNPRQSNPRTRCGGRHRRQRRGDRVTYPPPHDSRSQYPTSPPSGWPPQGSGAPLPPRRTTRRVALTAAGAAGALLAVGGAFAALHHGSSSTGADAGSGADQWNPGTLPTAAGAPGAIGADDIQHLLDVHNRALTSRDKNTYTSLYAPGAAAAAARLFDNLGRFDFASARYTLLGQGSRQFAAGSATTVEVDIAFVHKLRGIDADEVPEWYRWTLSRPAPGAPVTITAVAGTPSIGGAADDRYVYFPAIWDSPNPITVIKRPSVILAAETDADAAVMLHGADDAAAAVAANRAAWNRGHSAAGIAPGALIVGTSSRDRFYAFYSGRANQRGFEAGLCTPLVTAASMDSLDTARRFGGSRIVVDLTTPYFTTSSGQTNPRTLYGHEDTHNMVFPLMTASEQSVPLRDVEGFADWFAKHGYNSISGDPNLPAVRASAAGQLPTSWDGKSLPDNAAVYASDPQEMAAGYGLSTLIFHFIYAKKGLDGVCAFLTANYAVPGAHGTNGIDDEAAAVQAVLGLNLTDYQDQWARFVHGVLAA